MSIVATPPLPPPLTHQPFSESDIYSTSPSSSSSSGSTATPLITPPPQSERTLVPFPVFQHRHSSPFPSSQSFSALGPGPAVSPPKPNVALGTIPPPPAPRPPPMNLPGLTTPDGSELMVPTTLPPTPDPSPPNSKVIFPDAMIKLAPPADEQYDLMPECGLEGVIETAAEEVPRRLPLIPVDQLTAPPTESNLRKRASIHAGALTGLKDTNPRPKSMGPTGRPMRRSQTAIHPSSIRLVDSRGVDSRSRIRSSVTSPRNTSGQPLLHTPRSTSPGLPRALTSPIPDTTLTPRAASVDSDPPDMGGPDGLEAKVVLLGSQNAGKTSLILRYTTRVFSPSPVAATIGSSLHARKLIHDGVRVKLQIWDTAGQERFRSMAPIYYRGAHVCVLVYDVTDRRSFEDVRSWLEELSRTVPKETVIYVVGSKIDLVEKRVITPVEAEYAIRAWVRPPPLPRPELTLSPPSSRSIFRSTSGATPNEPPTSTTSILSSPIPSRSHSHSALTSLNTSTPTIPPPRQPSEPDSRQSQTKTPPQASNAPKPSIQIVTTKLDSELPTSPRARKLSFPALQSPTLPTSVTFTEPIKPSMTPASPPSRHGISGGRFSISGVLGYNRSTSISGAVSNLARLAEDNPTSPRQSQLPLSPASSRAHSFGAETPSVRSRTDSNPRLDNRRKSEDWSSRSWRMGEGPGAAEALGEFGAGVKKKQSGEMLGNGANFGKNATIPIIAGGGLHKKGRARGGSLGRDSRLYGTSDESDEDDEWGVEVEGMRVGEVSSATGQGVEALFKSITALLVQKKERIERERTLRRKDSIMLTADPTAKEAKTKSKGCCA